MCQLTICPCKAQLGIVTKSLCAILRNKIMNSGRDEFQRLSGVQVISSFGEREKKLTTSTTGAGNLLWKAPESPPAYK